MPVWISGLTRDTDVFQLHVKRRELHLILEALTTKRTLIDIGLEDMKSHPTLAPINAPFIEANERRSREYADLHTALERAEY